MGTTCSVPYGISSLYGSITMSCIQKKTINAMPVFLWISFAVECSYLTLRPLFVTGGK
jgi:hypothetical protein